MKFGQKKLILTNELMIFFFNVFGVAAAGAHAACGADGGHVALHLTRPGKRIHLVQIKFLIEKTKIRDYTAKISTRKRSEF